MNTENYKNKRREDNKSVEQKPELEGMEEANQILKRENSIQYLAG